MTEESRPDTNVGWDPPASPFDLITTLIGPPGDDLGTLSRSYRSADGSVTYTTTRIPIYTPTGAVPPPGQPQLHGGHGDIPQATNPGSDMLRLLRTVASDPMNGLRFPEGLEAPPGEWNPLQLLTPRNPNAAQPGAPPVIRLDQ